jgi:ABC-2 type transport system permease protein
LQGVIAALVVLPVARVIMGPIPGLTLAHTGALVVVTIVGATTFSTLGLLIGSMISPQQIGLMFSIIIAPMIFFGCAYYPWRGLDVVPVVQYAVLVNPLVYVAEGMRGALTPDLPHMSLAVVTGAQLVILTVFYTLGMRSFMRRAVG